LEVYTLDGNILGRVERLMETGANDVLVVRGTREHLVPFVQGQYVKRVDLAEGKIEVDWDPEF
jgi:16S rRNA processing protein RimM